MDVDTLLAITLIVLGIERFAAGLPGWIAGILALLTDVLMLIL